jgi:hypothetical protein
MFANICFLSLFLDQIDSVSVYSTYLFREVRERGREKRVMLPCCTWYI